MGDSLVRGLELALDASGLDASLVVRSVAGGHAGAYTEAAALLESDVDLIVAGVSAPVADFVAPLAREQRTPLIVANVGAHAVAPQPRDGYVLHNSLLFWQSSFAAGAWAARTLGRRAVLASSRADAGYDALYAFRRAFESAGGTVAASFVTETGAPDGDLAELFDAVRRSRPSVVYASYSGREAVEFVRAYAAAGLRRHAPLVCTPFATEDHQLAALGGAAVGVRSVASWTASARTPAGVELARGFRAATGRPADAFAALGYDTGLLVAAGLVRAAKLRLGRRRLVEALAGASVEGPRGRLRVDGRTSSVRGPLTLRTVRRTPTRLANVELRRLPAVSAAPRALGPILTGESSRYVNEYLCA